MRDHIFLTIFNSKRGAEAAEGNLGTVKKSANCRPLFTIIPAKAKLCSEAVRTDP